MLRPRMFILFLLCALPLAAQEPPRKYVTGADFAQKKPDCPMFIWHVGYNSPAERAGLKAGDAIVSIDGIAIRSFDDLHKIPSDKPKPVRVEVMRADGRHMFTVEREPLADVLERQGRKLAVGDAVVPIDMSDDEVRKLLELDPTRIVGGVFNPTHYPADEQIYYPGFELLLLKGPEEVVVGGMEDGPAIHAGVRNGDVVVAVNGKPVHGLSVVELEKLFSSALPATMKLHVRRLQRELDFEFPLWKAADVLRVNQKKIVQGQIAPAGLADKDLGCWLEQ